MMRSTVLLLALSIMLPACSLLFEPSTQGGADGGSDVDATSDLCDDSEGDEFAEINVPDSFIDDPSVSASGLELFYNRDGGIWTARRSHVCDPWEDPRQLPIGLVNLTDPSLEPDGLVLHFVQYGEPRTLSRTSLDSPWSQESVHNKPLQDRIYDHYLARGVLEENIAVGKVFRPSAGRDVFLITAVISGQTRLFRDDGPDGSDVNIPQVGPSDFWSTEDESELFYRTEQDRLHLSHQDGPGNYSPGTELDTRGTDPWVLTLSNRRLLYFALPVGPNLRELRVTELD